MPKLKRAKITVAVTQVDLFEIEQSTLFNDMRFVDVHYAFIFNGDLSHMDFNQCMSSLGSHSRRRSIVCATFVEDISISTWNLPNFVPEMDYVQTSTTLDRCYLWYTLPWVFHDITRLSIPDRFITQLQVFNSSQLSTMFSSSRLRRMNIIDNFTSPLLTLPHLLSRDSIEELNFFCFDRNIRFPMPLVHRVNLIDSLDALHNCSLISMNIRSIRIAVRQYQISYAKGNWTALRILSQLPLLRSVRVLMYDIYKCPDDEKCEILAQTAISMVDFAFSFRVWGNSPINNREFVFHMYRLFIERLHQTILSISSDHKPEFLIEQGSWGLIMWH